MKRLIQRLPASLTAGALVSLLCIVFRPNGDVGAFIQHPATAAWGQVLGAGVAVWAAWHIARRDHREARDREAQSAKSRRIAILAIIDECIEVLAGLDRKASSGGFTAGNVSSSIELAKSSADAIASLPLLEMDGDEVKVVAKVRTHMATAARRAKFIQNHIRASNPWAHIEFASLLRQVQSQAQTLRT